VTAPIDTEPSAGQHIGLTTKATRAFGWSFLNNIVGRFGTLAIGIALARLLGPEAFGTFAVAMVALLAVLSFNELGVSLAIVRWVDDPKVIAPTVNTLSVAMSTLLLGLVWFAAPAFSEVMGDPSATPVVRLMALSILISGVVAAPAALMQRNFRQSRRMAIDQVNTWLGAAVSLGLAVFGLGAMSLAVGRIAGSVASAILFIAWSPLPYRFGFHRDIARRLLRFGLPLAGASVIVFLVGYTDQLVVGSRLGAIALGFYLLAFNLSSWPVSIFSQPLRSVAPAAFARLQDQPARMNSVFLSVFGILFAVTIPACTLLAAAAVPVVRVVYGEQWLPSAAVLSWLAVTAITRIFFELSYDYLVVRRATRNILIVQVVWLIALPPVLLAGVHFFGLAGAAAGQVLVSILIVVPAYCLVLRRAGVRLAVLAREVFPSALAGVAIVGFTYAVVRSISLPLVVCLVAGLFGMIVIASLLFLKRRKLALIRSPRVGAAAP
jgi:PST family polysaccharide transporter